MVSSKSENNNNMLSAGVRKTIQSIKEIVGNHSDADIYNTLKDSNMDPNETAQKLLNQDPFHEVKRKRDKKKEVPALTDPVPVKPRNPTEQPVQGIKSNTYSDRNPQRSGFVRNGEGFGRNSEGSARNSEGFGRNREGFARNREGFGRDREDFVRNREGFVRNREGFVRNSDGFARNSEGFARNNEGFVRNSAPDSGVSKQFRVVRDNRIKHNGNRETKPSAKSSDAVPAKEPQISKASEKSPAEASKDLKSPSNLPVDSLSKQVKGVSLSGSERNDRSGGKKATVSNVTPPVQATKPQDSQQSSVTSPNSSVVGVYSSASDPVHIPSLASRPAANVGAIKREVGAVGAKRHTSEKSVKENFRSFPAVSKSDQSSHSNVSESAPVVSTGRALNNSRSHQPATHQKVSQANKEWKPKSGRKPNVTDVGVIGTPKKSKSSPAKNSKATETAQLQDKPSLATTHEDQNVIIAAHIRVSETDRCRLTFGTLGIDVESSKNPGYQEARLVEESHLEPLASSSVSPPDSSGDEPSGSKLVESLDERVQTSGSVSPASEQQSTDRLESSSIQNIDNYSNIGLVRHSSPSYTPSEPQQQQGPPELPSFSAYDPQTGYDMSFYRPATDESLRGQVLQMPQEAYSSHMANNTPATTIPMVQQQAPLPQMYPQVHVPHYAMPFRQFLSPVYVPPMVMPNYNNNPSYSPHPSTGSSYVLMPGVNSPHVNANGLKYAIPQFKSIQGGSPTGFGNFTSPNGYTLNPGVVGSASGLDDSSRLKYKDGNIYVPNPQAETSELWMNPRDMPSMQSASYYNMAGQSPHAAYLQPSHGGHASFNAAAAAQSSHMQFPGMYHPSQPGGIVNPHHMGPTMGGNVGVAPGAPGSQVGGYQQQPQLSQMSWTGNF
ncbi:hypothetical protein CTI12_AA028770 [Artemisia annua]|uniref:GBF-interacting protein 1 N-terminal domain-containing protein n=1 Tax=Artemisia annua TaxID=35608 RepID=A0A2U1QHK6_ARTAN|nr:hypothetical protein CTI12_AA028770 [Artemisia annua]